MATLQQTNTDLSNEYFNLYSRLRSMPNRTWFLSDLQTFVKRFKDTHPIIDTPTDDYNLHRINHEYINNVMQINNFFNNNYPPLYHIDRTHSLVQEFYKAFITEFSSYR